MLRDDIPPDLLRLADAPLEHPVQGATSEVAFLGDVVIKRCTDPRYREWLRNEHRVLLALSSVPAAPGVPRVLGFVDRGGDVWLASTRLPGISFATALAVATESNERERLMRELGAFLRRLHATPIPEALRTDFSWIDRKLAQAHQHSIDRALLDELVAHRPADAPHVLIHGDLGLDNVLVHEGHVASLIDWPMGDAGDARMDTALALDGEPLSEREVAAFWEGYGTAPPNTATLQWFQRLWDFF